MAVKIVRDRIRSVDGYISCDAEGFRYVNDAKEHEALLYKKILEELGELMEAYLTNDPAAINAEAADVREALEAFVGLRTGISPAAIGRLIERKQMERGGFKTGLVWEHP